MQKYNHDVDMATKYLFEVVVPRFADSLCEVNFFVFFSSFYYL